MFKTSTSPTHALLCTALLIFSLFVSLTPPIYPAHSALRVNSPVMVQEQPPLSGYPIQYTSFAGTTYNLTAYDGKYTPLRPSRFLDSSGRTHSISTAPAYRPHRSHLCHAH